MIPGTVFDSRHLFLLVFFCVIAAPFVFSSTGNTAPIVQDTTFGYCMTDPNNSVVYFSDSYDTRIRRPARIPRESLG